MSNEPTTTNVTPPSLTDGAVIPDPFNSSTDPGSSALNDLDRSSDAFAVAVSQEKKSEATKTSLLLPNDPLIEQADLILKGYEVQASDELGSERLNASMATHLMRMGRMYFDAIYQPWIKTALPSNALGCGEAAERACRYYEKSFQLQSDPLAAEMLAEIYRMAGFFATAFYWLEKASRAASTGGDAGQMNRIQKTIASLKATGSYTDPLPSPGDVFPTRASPGIILDLQPAQATQPTLIATPPVMEVATPPVKTETVENETQGSTTNMKCPKCRKSVTDADPFCPHCGTPTAILPVICPHCAQEHPPTLQFCPKTGQRIGAKPVQVLDKRPKPVMLAIAGMGILILLLGIYFGFRHFIPSNNATAVSNGITATSKKTTVVQPTPMASPPPALPPNPSKPVATFTDGIASASSFEPPHVAQYAFDGNPKTIWHTEEYQNAWISIKYPVHRHVTQIGMIVGSLVQFQESARIKEVRLRFSNGETQMIQFDDTNHIQMRKMSQPVLTDSIKFEIVGLYPGKTNHLIVPEIIVRGYEQ